MSISTRQNEVVRYQKQLADLQKKLADESKKEASKNDNIHKTQNSITKSTSISTLKSKQQQITRLTKELSDIQRKQAEINKKIADTNAKFHKAQDELRKEEEKERKKNDDLEKKREREQLNHQKLITQELRNQRSYHMPENNTVVPDTKYDVFISHATEDKEDFVKSLADALQIAGYKVWYDDFTLKIGDSLRESIDNGLANSRYGIVVFSSAFFQKKWPGQDMS